MGVSEVGILYLVSNELLMDRTSIEQAEDYGEFKIHPNDHATWWKSLGFCRPELQDVPYDRYPRGRVAYSVKEDRFYIYMDRCLLGEVYV